MEELEFVGLTVEEMIEKEAQFEIGLAVELLKEGYVVKRASKDLKYMLKQDSFGSCKEEDIKTLIATVDDNGKTTSYQNFNTDDILAEDWIVIG